MCIRAWIGKSWSTYDHKTMDDRGTYHTPCRSNIVLRRAIVNQEQISQARIDDDQKLVHGWFRKRFLNLKRRKSESHKKQVRWCQSVPRDVSASRITEAPREPSSAYRQTWRSPSNRASQILAPPASRIPLIVLPSITGLHVEALLSMSVDILDHRVAAALVANIVRDMQVLSRLAGFTILFPDHPGLGWWTCQVGVPYHVVPKQSWRRSRTLAIETLRARVSSRSRANSEDSFRLTFSGTRSEDFEHCCEH